mmetsp:Transcript_54343/g.87793  ORF Transcript_54343/g.87793 Transcript_54343/m.87793 type:complete len:249 (-) Transcript_54343:49-795(-)
MDESHRVHDLMSKQLRIASVPLQLFLQIANAPFRLVLWIKGSSRVVVPQTLTHQLLRGLVALLRSPVALLRPLDQLPKLLLERLKVQQVPQADAVADALGGVAWANATLGGADGVARRLRFKDAVDDLMAVKQQVRTGGDKHTLNGPWIEVLELVELAHQSRNVAHDTVADEILTLFVDDAAGQEVEGILLPFNYQRVPCIGSAIEASAQLSILGQDVHELAFALVAPLRAQHDAKSPVFLLRLRGRF